MRPRRNEKVLAVRRREHGVEALATTAGLEGQSTSGEDPVHRESHAPEVVARRVEHDEVEAGGGLLRVRVATGLRGPEERVVERVEVGALRDGCPARIARAVRADYVGREA